MKAIAINGSPRKQGNTATLLNKALAGAASLGAETEIVNLYDIDYKGCQSCYACKLKGGKSYGKCAQQDGLTPVLERIRKADVLIMGSPLYLAMISGEMKTFLERFMYPYVKYSITPPRSLFPGKPSIGFIYTMGQSEDGMRAMGYDWQIKACQTLLDWLAFEDMSGKTESLVVNDTYMFDDYSKYDDTAHNVEAKEKRRREVFPVDCDKAFEMGIRLAKLSENK
jgi:multimeric flavodoxin WrbA